jgi:hypothetical protein
LFQRVIVISSSWSGHQRMLESEVGSTKILWNVSNILQNNIVLHPQKLESSKHVLF